MGVKMIWPHDRTGLSLISPNLSQNKAARRKRATERKETLTPVVFLGALLNQSEPRSKTVGGMTGQQWRGQ